MTQPHTPRLPNLLVVENSPAIRRLFQVVLRRVAAQVFLAVDQDSAHALLEEEAIDMAIVEPQGPTTLSWNVLDELVALAIPTIVVTSNAAEDVLEEAARHNASAVLTKPFTPDILVDAINRLPDHRSEINVDISGTKTNSVLESPFE